MKTIKLLLLVQLPILIIISCTSQEEQLTEQLIDQKKLMEAYKNEKQIKPEIISISIDSVINKSHMFDYYDSIQILEKEKQIVENRISEEKLAERIKTGEHWFEDRKMTENEEKSIQKMLDQHKEKIRSVMNGGDLLDSVKTLRKIARFQKQAGHDTIKYQLAFFTVEQKESPQSGIKYDKWFSLKTNQDGPMEEKFLSLPPKLNSAELAAKVLNNTVGFNPYKKYRKY